MTLRELDAQLATVVMNEQPCTCEKNDKGHSVFQYDPDSGRCNFCGNRSTPHFTRDPAASAMLREKVAEKYEWLMGRQDGKCPFAFALYEPSQTGEGRKVAECWSTTEELATALCIAAAYGIDTSTLEV